MLLPLVALGLLTTPVSGGEHTTEYELKAAFLLNFARLVEWPSAAFPDAAAPLTIGIFGGDPFDGSLRSMVNGERVQGRLLRVRRVDSVSDARTCQLLFLPVDQSERLRALRRELGEAAVLLVGETQGFARRGGSINFYPESGRIRFEVNRRAAERAGLRLSSRLLRLARLVEPGDD
jgi:hypothetical protein